MRRRTTSLWALAAFALIAAACADDGGETATPESTDPPTTVVEPPTSTDPPAPPAATTMPPPIDTSACDDPADDSLTIVEGTIVVSDRFDDGHPQHLALATDPIGGPFLIDGREWLRIQDSRLSRELRDHIGDDVVVCGSLRTGYTGDTALTVVLVDVDGDRRTALEYIPPDASWSGEGTIVVLERHEDGHPRVLGLDPVDGSTAALVETNKSRELHYRIGRDVRIAGQSTEPGVVDVASYEDLVVGPAVRPGDGYRLSFLAGGLDADDRFMGGVEIDTLMAFDGRIFAGTSYRKNTQLESPDPGPAIQVLALDEPDGRWRLDFEVRGDDAGNAPRAVFASVVRFETDADGNPLDEPVEMLAMAGGNGEVYLRAPGDEADWAATGLPAVIRAAGGRSDGRADVRSVGSFTDPVTGVSSLFAGAGVGRQGAGGGIYRGGYDPDLPERIRWDPVAEVPVEEARNPRVTGLAEAHGSLYSTVGTRLLRRENGPAPTWSEVWADDLPSGLDSLRNIVAITSPGGARSLLVTVEGANSRIVRIDLDDDDRATVEFDLIEAFPRTLYGVAGYNGGRAVTTADGDDVTLFGIMLHRPRTTVEPEPESPALGSYQNESSGVYLWRDADGVYRMSRIVDETLEIHPPLQGVRDIVARSPFPGEEEVTYFAGFDHNDYLFHDTGWIMKAHHADVFDPLQEFPAASS